MDRRRLGGTSYRFVIGLLLLAVQSCGGGGGGGAPASGVGPTGATGSVPELTSLTQISADSFVASAGNAAGEVLLLVLHEGTDGSLELKSLAYTPVSGWSSPMPVMSGPTLTSLVDNDSKITALVLSDSGDAVFAWGQRVDTDPVGDTLWTVARDKGVWQPPQAMVAKIDMNTAFTFSLAVDPSLDSVAGLLWHGVVSPAPYVYEKHVYVARYRSVGGWDPPEAVPLLMGSESVEELLDARLGMDAAGNQYVAGAGDFIQTITTAPYSETHSGIRVVKRTSSAWAVPEQIYTFTGDAAASMGPDLHFDMAPAGTAAIAYMSGSVSGGSYKRWFRTFFYNGISWSSELDTPSTESGTLGYYVKELNVDDAGNAALLISDGNGSCYRPKTGWSAFSVAHKAPSPSASWLPCLAPGGIALWHDIFIKPFDTENRDGGWIAMLGDQGWSEKHLLTDEWNMGLSIHPSAGGAVVIAQRIPNDPSKPLVPTLQSGLWIPPSAW